MPSLEKAGARLKQIDLKMMIYTGLGFSILYVILNKYVLNNRFSISIITIFIFTAFLSFIMQSFMAKTTKEKISQEQIQQNHLRDLYGNKELESNWKRDY